MKYISLQKQLLCVLVVSSANDQIQSSELCIYFIKPPELSSEKWFFVQLTSVWAPALQI